ncbi:MAG TPA: hypothetical protein V6D48_09165 [Oculatellaceae cyanobacterium]
MDLSRCGFFNCSTIPSFLVDQAQAYLLHCFARHRLEVGGGFDESITGL